MKKELSDYEREMNNEIEERLSILENKDYNFGKTFNKWDWVFVGVMVFVGLGIILYGAF